MLSRGDGFVLAGWGDALLTSVNASITRPITNFETLLRSMSREVGLLKKGERHLFSSADISTVSMVEKRY